MNSRVGLKVSIVDGLNQLFGHLDDFLLASYNTRSQIIMIKNEYCAFFNANFQLKHLSADTEHHIGFK